MDDIIIEKYRPAFNKKDWDYFSSLLGKNSVYSPESSAKKWDKRAESWKQKRQYNPNGDDRAEDTVRFLEQRGVLHKECDVVDIGCGPGRFAAAFAKKAHSIVGLDISEKMITHGIEYLKKQNITNARLYTCDFQTLDIKRENYKGAFDLVFSSMTPAIVNMDGLIKSMEMSRGYCCNITQLHERNYLMEQIMKDVINGTVRPRRANGRWFYALINILFLSGYDPEISYVPRHKETLVMPNDEYAEFFIEHTLPAADRTNKNASKILSWLKSHADKDGYLQEITDSCYARILWNVNTKNERPDYRVENQEVRL